MMFFLGFRVQGLGFRVPREENCVILRLLSLALQEKATEE